MRAIAQPNGSLVFIVGCPRSGTTFTAGALGGVTGFVDLGEVPRFKGAVPELFRGVADGHRDESIRRIRSIIKLSQHVAMAGAQTAVEQSPESTFLIAEIVAAFPAARFLHVIRDGRDVASSLLERGWLASDSTRAEALAGNDVDDAGHAFGNYARFWVEPGREREFASASDATRCGWAWRRYVTSALEGLSTLPPQRSVSIRYEDLVSDPTTVGHRVAAALGADDRASEFVRELSKAHSRSVGQWTTRLTQEELDDVLAQETSLLTELGYIS